MSQQIKIVPSQLLPAHPACALGTGLLWRRSAIPPWRRNGRSDLPFFPVARQVEPLGP